jgi:hypothetical protein
MKLHLCNGTVYLDGYINIDHPSVGELAQDYPEEVERRKTTVDNYYKEYRGREDFMKSSISGQVISDRLIDISHLVDHFPKGRVEEIRIVQALEHFSRNDACFLIEDWHDLLEDGGLLHIDVPDILGIYKEYIDSDRTIDDQHWMMRQIYGSQKNKWSFHKYGYTTDILSKMMKDIGFTDIRVADNIHTYPAIAVEGVK